MAQIRMRILEICVMRGTGISGISGMHRHEISGAGAVHVLEGVQE